MRSHGHTIGNKDGLGVSPTYQSWQMMRKRCENSNHDRYKWYGARGITVCERWQRFENFLEDMGERPNGMSIDRIDNDGNYEAANCKWITHVEQIRKKRATKLNTEAVKVIRFFVARGASRAKTARVYGVSRSTVSKLVLHPEASWS